MHHESHASEKTMTPEIVVKFVARGNSIKADPLRWLRQFPNRNPVWSRCRFSFDPDLDKYDWLVAYDDLPTGKSENLACPRQNTLLITSEPSSVKIYGSSFLRQFGTVLTSQEPWVIDHPNAIFSQAGLRWYYGIGKYTVRDHDALSTMAQPDKSQDISTVCSAKQQAHTLHRKRYQFVKWLRERMPEMDVYGHGVCDIDDKADAVDPYKCHIAIENHVCQHHWTEKLADCYLGWSLPIYHGCPNTSDYFPVESFISIDIDKPEEALKKIKKALTAGEYERRLPSIREARRRILEEYNLFAVISRIIEQSEPSVQYTNTSFKLHSRHAFRRNRLMLPLMEIILEKIRYFVLNFRKKQRVEKFQQRTK
jgi:hypothetical protein